MEAYLEAVKDYGHEKAGALVGKTGEWARLWRTGERETLQDDTRERVRDYLAKLKRGSAGQADKIDLPSRETLKELRDWLDVVLPTSRVSDAARPSVEQMAAWLEEQGWQVIPPEGRRGGGGDGGA